MEGREKDVQELCKQVMEECHPSYNINQGTYSCPFCCAESFDYGMQNIKHDSDCAYLIAKDLSTNLR